MRRYEFVGNKSKQNMMRRCQLIPNKRHKAVYNEEDRISGLAEAILVKIVSLLPLREAAATSILSRRWRKVWTFVPNLNLDGEATLMRMMQNYPHRPYHKEIESERSKFITWVNSVINQHADGISLAQFRIYFDLDDTSTSSIDSWVEFAIKNRVQILELDLMECGAPRDQTEPFYILRRQLFAGVGLKSLKVLYLTSVMVSGEDIEFLLSKCQVLERLKVHDSINLVNLRVAGPSLSLKFLELYLLVWIQSIEIFDAQNLASFYLHSFESKKRPLKLLVRNVPMLVDVRIKLITSLDYVDRAFTMLSCCLSQLQTLQLDVSFEPGMKEHLYPRLTNLKQLSLILNHCDYYNLVKIIPFVKASPYLQKLILKLYKTNDECSYLEKVPKYRHNYLKELEIIGYSGVPTDVKLITYFVKNAVSLEKVIISCVRYNKEYPWRQPKTVETMEEEEIARDHAINVMKKKVPLGVEYICL